MIPPTSIDGTDITGATIDGTDVQEITVDGDVVFSAAPSNLPVAYSNMVGWWPFDATTYGGSNLDDVTAKISGSADSTAYDGTLTLTGSHDANGGVTDIRAGGNSGGFDLGSNNARVDFGPIPFVDGMTNFTIAFWLNRDSHIDFKNPITSRQDSIDSNSTFYSRIESGSNSNEYAYFQDPQFLPNFTILADNVTSTYHHFVLTADGSTVETYENGSASKTISQNGAWKADSEIFTMGARGPGIGTGCIQGVYDDVRLYNRALTASEVNQIYQNTQP